MAGWTHRPVILSDLAPRITVQIAQTKESKTNARVVSLNRRYSQRVIIERHVGGDTYNPAMFVRISWWRDGHLIDASVGRNGTSRKGDLLRGGAQRGKHKEDLGRHGFLD